MKAFNKWEQNVEMIISLVVVVLQLLVVIMSSIKEVLLLFEVGRPVSKLALWVTYFPRTNWNFISSSAIQLEH